MQFVFFKVPTRIVDKLPSVRVYMFGSATLRGGGTPRSPNHFHGWAEDLTVISASYKKAQSTRIYGKRLVIKQLTFESLLCILAALIVNRNWWEYQFVTNKGKFELAITKLSPIEKLKVVD